jgi:hypothetical protein
LIARGTHVVRAMLLHPGKRENQYRSRRTIDLFRANEIKRRRRRKKSKKGKKYKIQEGNVVLTAPVTVS